MIGPGKTEAEFSERSINIHLKGQLPDVEENFLDTLPNDLKVGHESFQNLDKIES